MKRERVVTFLAAAALAFALSLAAVGCLRTGFDLTLEDGTAVTLVCAAVSLLGALCFSVKGGGTVVLGLLALGLGYLWRRGTALEQILALAQRISRVYDSAYGWGSLELTGQTEAVEYPLALLGALTALAVSRTVCRGKGSWLAMGLPVLSLALCLVVTDTVPEEGCLLALMAGVVLLLLTAEVRRDSLFQGTRLLLQAAVPVTAALGLLFLAIPQESYVNQSGAVRERLLSLAAELPARMEETTEKTPVTVRTEGQADIDLKNAGAQVLQTYPVMDVTSRRGGVIYLREQDYDVYSGTGWSSTPDRREVFALDSGEADTVTIRTRGARDMLYLPYYPAGEAELLGGMLENGEDAREYTFYRTALPEAWREAVSSAAVPSDLAAYLELPRETEDRAGALLADILPGSGSVTQNADAIAAYVRSSAVYDLATQRMPSGETDFALWFLEESETGYCVHFATAATVLLRAAGIPARYVSGYMVRTQPGEQTTVIAGNAHAWAEYYEPALMTWVVLEATPAAPGEEAEPTAAETETRGTTEPETTTHTEPPRQTAPSEAPSVPTETGETPVSPPDLSGLLEFLKGLSLAAALICAAALQRNLRLLLRRRNQKRGSANAQALARWREVTLLAKLLREEPPEDLLNLAQKAKFSQHALTAEELGALDAYRRTARRRLKEKPWYLRLVYRYLFAAF